MENGPNYYAGLIHHTGGSKSVQPELRPAPGQLEKSYCIYKMQKNLWYKGAEAKYYYHYPFITTVYAHLYLLHSSHPLTRSTVFRRSPNFKHVAMAFIPVNVSLLKLGQPIPSVREHIISTHFIALFYSVRFRYIYIYMCVCVRVFVCAL